MPRLIGSQRTKEEEKTKEISPLSMANDQSTESSLTKLVPVEAVLFDIDGTLCDSDPLHHQAFEELLLEIGYNNGVPIDEEFFIKNIAGRSDKDGAKNLFPDWDLEKGLEFFHKKDVRFLELAAEKLVPVQGLYEVTKWIQDKGLKRAAVTNAPRKNAELMISKVGLNEFFNGVVICGDECERSKPFPDPYLKGLKEIDASPNHTFIFEDSPSGIKAGVAAGMPVIGLATRNPENLLNEAGATFLIKNYEDPKLWSALKGIDTAEAKLKESSN